MTIYGSESTQSCSKRSAPRSLTVVAFGVACAGMLLTNVVPAQVAKKPTIAPEDTLVYVVAKVQEAKNKLTDEITQKSATIKALSDDVSEAERRRDDVDHQARIFNDSAESEKLNQELAAHDAACAGKMMQRPEYDRCQNWKNTLDARVDQHNAIFAEFRRRFDAEQEEVGKKIRALVLEQAGMTQLQNYFAWLTTAESKLAVRLTQDCKGVSGNASLEELERRCGKVRFDAARVELPACETGRCEGWAKYAKPPQTISSDSTGLKTLPDVKADANHSGNNQKLALMQARVAAGSEASANCIFEGTKGCGAPVALVNVSAGSPAVPPEWRSTSRESQRAFARKPR
jgi:hypothetical protein